MWYFILWGMSHPTNYIGVKGVKFHDLNLTMKLTNTLF